MDSPADVDHFQELAEATWRVFWGRQSGRLALQHATHSKDLYFHEGFLVAARSTIKSEALGRFLIARRLIDSDKYEEATLVAIRGKLRLGQALVRIGALTQPVLDNILVEQVRERFLSALGATQVTFRFAEESVPEMTVKPGHLKPVSLLRAAIARSMDMERLGRALQPWTDQPLAKGDDFADVMLRADFNAEERRALGAIDGRRRIGDLLSALGTDPTPFLQTLYLAKSLGLVRGPRSVEAPQLAVGLAPSPSSEPAAPPPPLAPPTPPDEPADQVMTVIEAAAAFQKGETAMQEGAFGGAVPFYQKAAKLQPSDPEYATGLAMAMLFLARSKGALTPSVVEDVDARASRALSQNPNLGKALLVRSFCCRERGRAEEEAMLYDKAMSLDPELATIEEMMAALKEEKAPKAPRAKQPRKLLQKATTILKKIRNSGAFVRPKRKSRRRRS